MSDADEPGRMLGGRYCLTERIGRGGMATVWKARDAGPGGFRRVVAVKRPARAVCADRQFARLFEEEARVAGSIVHPNVVQTYDYGVDDTGRAYLVMEHVEGISLRHLLAAVVMPWRQVVAIAIQILEGLEALHERRDEAGRHAPVVHRDISPHNLLVSVDGTVKLIDFGVARAMDRARLTPPHVVKGKLAYMAPELLGGARASPATDLYSFGVVLWEALADRRLFEADAIPDLLERLRGGGAPPLGEVRQGLPDELCRLVGGLLSSSAADRPEPTRAVAGVLTGILWRSGPPIARAHLAEAVKVAAEALDQVSRERSDVLSLPSADVHLVEDGPPEPGPWPAHPDDARSTPGAE